MGRTISREEVVVKYYAVVVAFSGRLFRRYGLNNIHSYGSEDVAQEVFKRVLESDREEFWEGSIPSYLQKACRNRFFDLLRKGRHREITNMDLPEIEVDSEAESLVSAKEDTGRIEAALIRLPESSKAAFLGRMGEKSYEQIAAGLGIKISAAKMRVSRTKKTLRGVLQDGECDSRLACSLQV